MDCARCNESRTTDRPYCTRCGMPWLLEDDASPARAPLESLHSAALWGFLVGADDGYAADVFWSLRGTQVQVGRDGSGADVALPHQTVSSCQAVMHYSGQPASPSLVDTGSRNGTFVNGDRLAIGTARRLRDGDRIRFGLYDTLLRIVE